MIDQSQVVEHKRALVIQQDEIAKDMPARRRHKSRIGKITRDTEKDRTTVTSHGWTWKCKWIVVVVVIVSANQRRDKLAKFCAHFTEIPGGRQQRHQLQADAFLG